MLTASRTIPGDVTTMAATVNLSESRAVPAGPGTRLVVGCGFLGLRVARRWHAAGDRVLGITRSHARAAGLAAEGIVPIVHDVTATAPSPDLEALLRAPPVDTVFWAVGFDRASGATHRDVHRGGLGRLLAALPGAPRWILSSSTGVWGDESGGVVDEDTPTNPGRESAAVLVEAERLLHDHPRGPGVALRFAGLYGPERLPRLDAIRAGLPIASDPDSWLNLIHGDDAAAIVCAVAAVARPAPLYVVSDGHPVRRRDWYGCLARATGSPPPTWDAAAPRARAADKRVDPARLFRDVPIELAHPNPLESLERMVRALP